jgi:diguanylate cyclase (GGDEF)-like protein
MIRYRPAGTRLTRHLVTLFVVCALLPLGAAIYVGYGRVHEALVTQRIALLKDAAASYGTALVDRLNAADAVSRSGALDADTGYFRAGVVLIPGPPRALFGDVSRMPGRAELADLDKRVAGGATGLALVRQADGSAAVWLVRTLGSRRLALELDPKYLWAVEDLPYLMDLCVLGPDAAPMACTRPLPETALKLLHGRAAGSRGKLAWEGADGRYLSGSTEIFLRGRFGAGAWTIVASQPEQHALAPVHAIGRLLVPLLLLAVLGAALVGVVRVRRALAPLQTLTEAAGRIGAGDFMTRVPQDRDDEFGALGGAFNAMSSRLGRQFASLAAHAEIDAAILEGVDLKRIVAIVLRRMAELAPADRHYLLLLEHRQDAERVYAVHSMTGVTQLKLSEREVWRLLAAPGGAVGLQGIERPGVFALPIALAGDLAGALVLAYDEARRPEPDEIPPLRDLADRVAVALATAHRDRQLQHRAHYDSLTQLPNRLLGIDELARAVALAERSGRSLAVLFVDLDGFSDVNDSAGHAAGDQLLVQAAARLRRCVRKSDVVARLGGDEFAVVLPEVRDAADAARAARNIVEALSAPFQVGANAFVSACVGIALYPGDGSGAEELLRHADLAMYRAKAAGRGQIAFFEVSMNAEIRRRVELEQELRVAMEEEQFVLHYQPQMDVKSGRIVGAEALVRWMHPERGLVPPSQFIAFAESSGMIMDLGRWVLRSAVAQFVTWQAHGIDIGHVSINVSPRQFRDPGFTGMVAEALRDFLLPPAGLRIEITESAVMDHAAVEANLAGISAFGVRLELDDFGTGYSSLAHLQRLPVAAIKLDRAFIRRMDANASGQEVVRAAIDMAHALGKSVVAEGVEHAGQLALLERMRCDTVQGYLLSPPVVADKLVELVSAGPSAFPGLRLSTCAR